MADKNQKALGRMLWGQAVWTAAEPLYSCVDPECGPIIGDVEPVSRVSYYLTEQQFYICYRKSGHAEENNPSVHLAFPFDIYREMQRRQVSTTDDQLAELTDNNNWIRTCLRPLLAWLAYECNLCQESLGNVFIHEVDLRALHSLMRFTKWINAHPGNLELTPKLKKLSTYLTDVSHTIGNKQAAQLIQDGSNTALSYKVADAELIGSKDLANIQARLEKSQTICGRLMEFADTELSKRDVNRKIDESIQGRNGNAGGEAKKYSVLSKMEKPERSQQLCELARQLASEEKRIPDTGMVSLLTIIGLAEFTGSRVELSGHLGHANEVERKLLFAFLLLCNGVSDAHAHKIVKLVCVKPLFSGSNPNNAKIKRKIARIVDLERASKLRSDSWKDVDVWIRNYGA